MGVGLRESRLTCATTDENCLVGIIRTNVKTTIITMSGTQIFMNKPLVPLCGSTFLSDSMIIPLIVPLALNSILPILLD